ncbi:alpha/beta hydrolase [Nonomuraea sp. NPDC050022]|uniref:alpha/beta hydrolase n=1 Tax=Nonomuraea sp. NPDC050022 TaxID=3364358 RepID=UPI00378D0D54
MRRFVALLSGLTIPLLLITPATATAERAEPAPAAISWTPCPEVPEVDCGTITVPVDWKHPEGGTFQVGVARRKATDPAARIGVLTLGAGGPGGSGVNLVLTSPRRFSPEVLRRFDIVGLDPRGTNRSHPILCSTDLLTQAPEPLMKSQADFDRMVAYNKRLRDDCRARTGPLFDHVDSLSTAADLDAFRAALGERQLSFWGGSYGTLLGQLYAERYPKRVRAFVLDSTMDHSLGTQAFMDTETWGAQDAFNEFAAWCDRDSRCLQHGQDVKAFWRGLLERADRGELHVPGEPDVPVTAFVIANAALGAFYDPFNWLALSQLLADLDTGRAAGDSTLRMSLTGAPKTSAEEVSPNPLQIFCLDYRLPIRDYREFAGHLRRMAKIAPEMRYSPIALATSVACLGTPGPIPNPQHRLNVRTDTPLLVANSLHDPATVYPWALGATRQLGRSGRLLTYEGWGHIVLGRGACGNQIIESYLLTQTLPAKGARCPAVPPAEVSTLGEPVAPQPGTPGWGFRF